MKRLLSTYIVPETIIIIGLNAVIGNFAVSKNGKVN